MTSEQVLERTKRDFTYVSDPGKDQWAIGPLNGAFKGDCEEFALTLLLRLTGSEPAMWAALEGGEAKIIHVLSARGNGHAVLSMRKEGYVDSIHQFWRDQVMFDREFEYTPAMIRKKLAGKTVRAPSNKKMLVLAGLIGAAALFFAFGGFHP